MDILDDAMTESSTEYLIGPVARRRPLTVGTAGRKKFDRCQWITIGGLVSCIALVVAFDIWLLVAFSSFFTFRDRPERPIVAVHQPTLENLDNAPLCRDRTCQWMTEYLAKNLDPDVRPCQNFYDFVCSKQREALTASGMQSFLLSLEQGFQGTLRNKSSPGASTLEACVLGHTDDFLGALFYGDEEVAVNESCSFSYHLTPFIVSEEFFARYPNGSAKHFRGYLFRRSPGLQRILQKVPQQASSTTPWLVDAVKRLYQSAACHLYLKTGSTEDIKTYATLWNILYFSPFIHFVYEELANNSSLQKKTRLEACLDVVEDNFPNEARSMGFSVLKKAIPDIEHVVLRFVFEAIHILEAHFNTWLIGNKPEVVEQFDTAKIALLRDNVPAPGGLSFLGDSVYYSSSENRFVIPVGLLGALLASSPNLDSMFVPLLGSEILRALLLVHNMTVWVSNDTEAWAQHKECISRHVAGASDSSAIVASHVALSPLFVLYRDSVRRQYSKAVRLNANFTNEQLFFVLWAAATCDEGSEAVNVPVLHSERFTKAFRCATGNGMVPEKRCPFWIR